MGVGRRDLHRARAWLDLSLLIVSLLPSPGQPRDSLFARDMRPLALALIAPRTQKTKDKHSPGIEALQRSALTSALPRAESSDARGDRVPAESGDEVTEPLLLFIPATAPPANTLVVESTLSSERRPSTRPSDVAGEGRAFSVVVSVEF